MFIDMTKLKKEPIKTTVSKVSTKSDTKNIVRDFEQRLNTVSAAKERKTDYNRLRKSALRYVQRLEKKTGKTDLTKTLRHLIKIKTPSYTEIAKAEKEAVQEQERRRQTLRDKGIIGTNEYLDKFLTKLDDMNEMFSNYYKWLKENRNTVIAESRRNLTDQERAQLEITSIIGKLSGKKGDREKSIELLQNMIDLKMKEDEGMDVSELWIKLWQKARKMWGVTK